MKKTVLGIALAVASTGALAGGVTQNNDNRHHFNNTTNKEYNTYNTENNDFHTTASGANSSSNLSVEGSDVSHSSELSSEVNINHRKQAPSIGLSVAGPCVGGGGGVSVAGFGGQVATVDVECTLRAWATYYHQTNRSDLAEAFEKHSPTWKQIFPE